MPRAVTLSSALKRLRGGWNFRDVIRPSQTVLIFPATYTGGSDWHHTPIGSVPGAHVMTSMVNSVLTGNWLVEAQPVWLFLLMIAILGSYLGCRLATYHAVGVTIAGAVLITAFGLSAFVYLNLVTPWLSMSLAFVSSAIACILCRSLANERRLERLSVSLSGVVSSDEIQRIVAKQGQLETKPQTHDLTILFLDLIDFSKIATRFRPEEVFEHLKEYIAHMVAIVHEHDGIVDKTLGDGLLAYFGATLDGRISEEHPLTAIACAKAIQVAAKDYLEKNMIHHCPPFVTRIGLNSHLVCVGDMRSGGRDITLIGDGVNLVQRMESACSLFRAVPTCVNYTKASES
jgi:class 3 adenylate cyclase